MGKKGGFLFLLICGSMMGALAYFMHEPKQKEVAPVKLTKAQQLVLAAKQGRRPSGRKAVGSASKKGSSAVSYASYYPDATILTTLKDVKNSDEENDTLAGYGLTGKKLFKLHKELRKQVQNNYNQAPSKKELEILNILRFGKAKREITAEDIIKKMTIKYHTRDQKNVDLFEDGYEVNLNLDAYRTTGNIAYLERAMVMADYIMADYYSRKGTGREYEAWAMGQGLGDLGRGYGGVAELATIILKDEALHNLEGIRNSGQVASFVKLNFLKKARLWVQDLQELVELRKSKDFYENGQWFKATGKKWKDKGEAVSTHSYLSYLQFLTSMSEAGKISGSPSGRVWAKGANQTVIEGMKYFQTTFMTPENLRGDRSANMKWSEAGSLFMSEHGPYVVWPYKPGQDNTEDYIHLMIDMAAIESILSHKGTLISDSTLKRIAVMLAVCTFNYETGQVPFNLDPRDKGIDPESADPEHRFYAPKYGKYIGKYLDDEAYGRFMQYQIKIWDQQLAKGELGPFHQYSMPLEIIEARYYRHNESASFPR